MIGMRAPRITFRRRWRAEDLLLATGIVIAVVGSVWYHDALVTAIVILTGAGTLATKLILGDRLRLLQLSLPGFFLASYLMLMAMPSLWIAERLTSDIRHTFLLATLSVPIWFMSGVLLASRGVSAPGTVVSRFLRGGAPGPEDRLLVPVFWAFLVAAVPILALVFVQAERVQLLEVFRPCDATIEAARANQENFRFSENLLPSWLQLAYEILRRFMLPFCVLYAAFLWRTGARGWSWIFAVLLPAALAVNLLTLDRAPPFALLVMLGLASLIGRSKGIGFSTVAVALSLFVAAALVGGATSLVQYQGSCALRPTPTPAPAAVPTTAAPTTPAPTVAPTTPAPTAAPTTPAPTVAPTTPAPTAAPTTPAPTVAPTTPAPTVAPTPTPTVAPTPTPPLALGPAVELLARVSPERLAGVSWYVVGYRVFQDAAFMNSVAFQLFDSPDKLLYGRTIRLLSYVGVPYVPGPPVSFVGDLWRNFGWPGVVSGSLALGWILQFSQLRLFSRWNAWRASLFVIVLVGSVWLIFGNAFGTITTGVPALAIALAGIGGLLVPRAHGDDRADRTTS